MMDIYKYPNIEGVYIIKKNNKLYNVLDSEHYDSNSFLKGGIILKSGKKTNKTSFPHNLMMNCLEDYKTLNSNGLIYDTNVWNNEDIENFKLPEVINVLPQQNIAMNIQLIEDVIKEVDNIKKLFKRDDNTLKSQWFMDYVVFDEESPPSVLDSFRNREYKINKSIQKLNELSQSFEINNNHQMKLWFKIFFDLDDTSVTDKNMNLKEEFKEPITVRTNQLNQQLKEAETKMEAKEEAKTENAAAKENAPETHTSNNAPASPMHDESNEKINSYIKNILSFLKNREQVSPPSTSSPPAAAAEAPAAEAVEAVEEVEAEVEAEAPAAEAVEAVEEVAAANAKAEAPAAEAVEAVDEVAKANAKAVDADEAKAKANAKAVDADEAKAVEAVEEVAATRALEAPATVNNVEKVLKEAKRRRNINLTSNIK